MRNIELYGQVFIPIMTIMFQTTLDVPVVYECKRNMYYTKMGHKIIAML